MRDSFGTYHPLINFIYFCAVIVFGMLFLHPILLGLSLLGAICYSIRLEGKKKLIQIMLFLVPTMIIVSLINPLFNHRGMTVLGYAFDNPITLESLIYGIATGLMFGSILLWFSCYNKVMTSDKVMYLFGKIIPAMSLIFSMVLRFVPRFIEKTKSIADAQRCIGRDGSSGTIIQRAKHGMKILSIMTTWALENAIDTADSMKSRGYGLKGRTAFSNYVFETRDVCLAIALGLLIGVTVAGAVGGYNTMQFFPNLKIAEGGILGIAIYIFYGVLCFLPVIIDIKEAYKWRHLQSEI